MIFLIPFFSINYLSNHLDNFYHHNLPTFWQMKMLMHVGLKNHKDYIKSVNDIDRLAYDYQVCGILV